MHIHMLVSCVCVFECLSHRVTCVLSPVAVQTHYEKADGTPCGKKTTGAIMLTEGGAAAKGAAPALLCVRVCACVVCVRVCVCVCLCSCVHAKPNFEPTTAGQEMHEKHAALEAKGIASVLSRKQGKMAPYSVVQAERGAILPPLSCSLSRIDM